MSETPPIPSGFDKDIFWAMVCALRVAADQRWKLTAESRKQIKFDETINAVEKLCQTCQAENTSSTQSPAST